MTGDGTFAELMRQLTAIAQIQCLAAAGRGAGRRDRPGAAGKAAGICSGVERGHRPQPERCRGLRKPGRGSGQTTKVRGSNLRLPQSSGPQRAIARH